MPVAQSGIDKIRRTWVGVRDRKKLAFLAAFAANGNITAAAAAAGIARATVYVWREHDEAFTQAMHVADEMATDALEEEAWRRAVDGVVKETPIIRDGQVIDTIIETKYSDGLMTLLLKARRPEKYKERVEHSGGVVPIKAFAGFDPVEV